MKLRKRKGAATTEMALCLPLIVVLTLGVMETCTVLHLKESVTLAAYEGARVGIRKMGTNAQVQSKIEDFLDTREISYESDFLEISDPGFDTAGDLEHVSVTVTVPCVGNTFTSWMFQSRSISATVTMRKEFENL